MSGDKDETRHLDDRMEEEQLIITGKSWPAVGDGKFIPRCRHYLLIRLASHWYNLYTRMQRATNCICRRWRTSASDNHANYDFPQYFEHVNAPNSTGVSPSFGGTVRMIHLTIGIARNETRNKRFEQPGHSMDRRESKLTKWSLKIHGASSRVWINHFTTNYVVRSSVRDSVRRIPPSERPFIRNTSGGVDDACIRRLQNALSLLLTFEWVNRINWPEDFNWMVL